MVPPHPDSPEPRARRPIDAMRAAAPEAAVDAFQAAAGSADNSRSSLHRFEEVLGDLPLQA